METIPIKFPVDAIVLDIEGTTTSISFVYDTLFPYARNHIETFLNSSWHEPAVQVDIAEIEQQANHDVLAGLSPPRSTPATPESITANLLWQMDHDRKTTGLKSIQGKVWARGYADGTLKGHVYEDVHPALKEWFAAQIPVFIYSSGSIAAQKLLFGHSQEGNLLPLLAGHFDTTTGPKKQANSYTTIARSIGRAPERILFVTDSLAEATAADAAGLQAIISHRPGNAELAPHPFPSVQQMPSVAASPPTGKT